MSPFFVKHFRRQNKCVQCSPKKASDKAPGKSLCGTHLRIARMAFRVWTFDRRLEGRCTYCDRKAVKDNCRCKSHRAINRQRCRAWGQLNSKASRKRQVARIESLIADGKCPNCPEHNALTAGFRRCDDCRGYSRKMKKGDLIASAQMKMSKRERRLAIRSEIAERTRAELAAMGFVMSRGTNVHRIET